MTNEVETARGRVRKFFDRLTRQVPEPVCPSNVGSNPSFPPEDITATSNHLERESYMAITHVRLPACVAWFAHHMAFKLSLNSHKGLWPQDSKLLYIRVNEELRELEQVLNQKNLSEIPKEAADVANFLMMLTLTECNITFKKENGIVSVCFSKEYAESVKPNPHF